MSGRPSLDRLDIAAFGAAVGLLVFAYVVYPDQILKYAVWIGVFIIWMVWFVYYGTKWLYSVDA